MSLRFLSSLFVVLFLVACGGTPQQQTETSDPVNTPLPTASNDNTDSSSGDNSVDTSSGSSSTSSVSTGSVSTSGDDNNSNVVPGSAQDFAASQTPRVFFNTNKHFISNQAAGTLRQQARWLRKHPETRIVIEGNCDERGTREYNYALGNRRALAVRDFLVSQGIPSYRIRTVSYGKDKPEFIGSNKTSWKLNRRAVTVIAN